MNEGGPAFPSQPLNACGQPCGDLQPGMTLRDYFAAKALQGACAVTGIDFGGPKGVAGMSYEIADAMIAERSKAEGRAS